MRRLARVLRPVVLAVPAWLSVIKIRGVRVARATALRRVMDNGQYPAITTTSGRCFLRKRVQAQNASLRRTSPSEPLLQRTLISRSVSGLHWWLRVAAVIAATTSWWPFVAHI